MWDRILDSCFVWLGGCVTSNLVHKTLNCGVASVSITTGVLNQLNTLT